MGRILEDTVVPLSQNQALILELLGYGCQYLAAEALCSLYLRQPHGPAYFRVLGALVSP